MHHSLYIYAKGAILTIERCSWISAAGSALSGMAEQQQTAGKEVLHGQERKTVAGIGSDDDSNDNVSIFSAGVSVCRGR